METQKSIKPPVTTAAEPMAQVSSRNQNDGGIAGQEDAELLGTSMLKYEEGANAEMNIARLGYKQELKRNFSTFEVFGIAFSIISLLPSIASTLTYTLPAGPIGMVWVCIQRPEVKSHVDIS